MESMIAPEAIRVDFVHITEKFYYYSALSEWYKKDGDADRAALLVRYALVYLDMLKEMTESFNYLSMCDDEAGEIMDIALSKAREDYKAFTA